MLHCKGGGGKLRLFDTLQAKRLRGGDNLQRVASSSSSSCKRNRLKINFPFHRQCDKECVCVRVFACACECVVCACSSRLSCRLFPTRRITIYWLLSANVLCVLSAFHLPRSPTVCDH